MPIPTLQHTSIPVALMDVYPTMRTSRDTHISRSRCSITDQTPVYALYIKGQEPSLTTDPDTHRFGGSIYPTTRISEDAYLSRSRYRTQDQTPAHVLHTIPISNPMPPRPKRPIGSSTHIHSISICNAPSLPPSPAHHRSTGAKRS